MASSATLGFSIISRYSGGGVRQAQRDLATLRAQMGTVNGDLQRHTNLLGGIPQRWKMIGTAVASVAPALIPLSAHALSVSGAFAAMSVGVGAALGVYGAALKGAISRTMDMAKAGKALTPVQKEYVGAVNGIRRAWQQFIKDTSDKTLSTATNVVQGLTGGIKLLKPILDAIHPSLLQVSKDFETWMKGDSAKAYAGIIAGIAKTSMPLLIQAGKNVLNVLGDGFRAFAPLANDVARSILRGSQALKGWSDGGGFQRFLQYVRQNGPAVQQFWQAFRDALRNVFNALHQFSGGSLSVLTDALRGIAAIDPSSIKAFAQTMLLLRAPMLFLVLNCPPLRDAMVALLGAMNPQIIYAVAAAFVALRIAFMFMNTALLTTPLGWVILGLTALGMAIVLIATKTTWFQTAWTYTWNAIKTVVEVVWNALKVAWNATVNAIITAWNAVSAAFIAAWNFVWNIVSTTVNAVWTALKVAWNAVVTSFGTVWTAVSAAFMVAWNFVWNIVSTTVNAIWTALRVAWNAVVTGFMTVWTVVSAAFMAAWNFIWNAIKAAAQLVWTGMQVAWNALVTAIVTVWNVASTIIRTAWTIFWTALRTIASVIWAGLQAAWNAFLTAVQAVWSAVSGVIRAAWNAFWTALRTIASAIWAGLRAAWQAFLTAVQTVWTTVSTILRTAWNTVWTAIRTVAQTIWNAIRAAWQALMTAVQTIWNTFSAFIRTAWSAVWNAIKAAGATIWNGIRGAWNGFIGGVKGIWNDFSGWIKDKWGEVWNALKGAADKIWHQIGEIIEKAINSVIGIVNGLIKGFNAITKFLHINVSIDPIDKVNFNFAEGGMVGLTPYMIGGMAEFAHGGVANLKRGGTLSGYAPGRDTVPAVLSRGEGVLTPEAVRGMGGPGFVHAANRKFAGHRGAGKLAKAPLSKYTGEHDHGPQSRGKVGFATGGMVGGVQHFAVGGITAAALAKAGVSLGMVTQGEYSNGSLSGGTHLGGGVVDIASTSPALVAALRAAGFAAWARGPEEGFAPHIHAVLMNHPDLSSAARAQVASFMAGGNGLGAGGGGGGGIDLFGELKEHIGKILKNVYNGLGPLKGVGGAIASMFGAGTDEDEGGLFGTGIGPDIGPDVAGAVGDAVGSVTGIGGEMMKMLGQIVLSMLDKGSIAEGLSDADEKLKGFGGIGGEFAKIAVGFGNKILKELMPDFLMDEKEKAGPIDMAAFGGAFGGGAGVQQWAGLALMALKLGGLSASQLPKFLALMQAESGGNPMAINNWDSNAAMGQASRGLMQVIPSTFAAYHVMGTSSNIFDPLANMAAAAAYIRARYGGNVPGSPYALGTPGATSGVHLVGEQGPELLNFAGGETVTPAKETASILGGAAGQEMPEDVVAQYQLLAQRAQEMATRVQTSWAMVTSSGTSAKAMLSPVFTDIATHLGTNIPAAMALMSTANTTHWLAMQTATTAAWTAMRDGTFVEAGDHMAVKMPQWGAEMNSGVSQAWSSMGEATATAWEGMKEGTRGPTNWIIENSYNNGLARLWNEVASVIFEDGAKQLPTVQALRAGGPVRGCGSERGDRVPAMLSRGEHVWTAREVHRAGGHHAVQAMRQGVMGGRGRGKVRGEHRHGRGHGSGCGFALGGWLGGAGTVGGGLSLPGLSDLKRGSLMEQAEPFLDALDSGVKGALGGSAYRKMGGSASALSPSDWMRQYIEKDDELNKIGSGGPPWVPGVSDSITSWGGVTVNQRTADMLNMAMAAGGSFSATQGSFSSGVAASAGTHDGGGVVDLVPANNGNVGALRAVGFAAWNRGAAWGSPSFSDHIHAVALGDPTVSPGAAAQVMSYLAGGNGLADGGPDNYSGGIPSVDGVSAVGGGRNVDPADLEQRVVSFDRGGLLQPGYTLAYNGTRKPEPVGHDLAPRGSGGVSISMPITINGNANAQEVVDGINSQVLPKLRQYLTKGTGSN